MLHDGVSGRRLNSSTGTDRRAGARAPYPADLVIAWHCSLPDTTRYQIVDVSDRGFRIRSSAPLVQGMTGTALRMLPEGHELNAGVMVKWCMPAHDGGGFEAGLLRLR